MKKIFLLLRNSVLYSSFMYLGAINYALAEEEGSKEMKSFEELGYTTPFRVVAFQDDPNYGDCNGVDAIRGGCLERVSFVDAVPSWVLADRFDQLPRKEQNILKFVYPGYQFDWIEKSKREKNKIRHRDMLQREQYAKLYAQMWDDLVYRWKVEGDAAIAKFKEEGFRTVVTPRVAWDVLKFQKNNRISSPELSSWMNERSWIPFSPRLRDQKDIPKGFLSDVSALFDQVSYALPKNYFVDPKKVVLLKGRFAINLGVNGKSHPYELMDANPVSSGPFFEQLYPYRTVYESSNERNIPLRKFRVTDFADIGTNTTTNPINIASLEDIQNQASIEFMEFYRLVATKVMQFSMQDYTINHMRILGTLNNMRIPPGRLEGARGALKIKNAAGIGETDTTESQEKEINPTQYSIPEGFAINYNRLPTLVTLDWIERLNGIVKVSSTMRMKLTDQAAAVFGNTLLKSDRPKLIKGFRDQDILEWCEENIMPGREIKILQGRLRNMVLRRLMETLASEKRDEEETWLLLDHVAFEIAQNMNNDVGALIAPQDFADLTASKWETVLGLHGYSSSLIEQGLGAIDPTSVCTTKARREALGEPAVGAVYVDFLFEGRDEIFERGEKVESVLNDDLLWDARAQLPFLYLDNPINSSPDIERLIALPDRINAETKQREQVAIYRARWKIWSGWHLLWGTEVYKGAERLTLRTGAFCSNMTMTSPDLVPTLVRGGLLIDNFMPTTPVSFADIEEKRRTDPDSLPDLYTLAAEKQKNKRPVNVGQVVGQVLDVAGDALDVAVVVQDKGTTGLTEQDVVDIANSPLTERGLDLQIDRKIRSVSPTRIGIDETVVYIQDFVRTPLEDLSAKTGGLMMVVMDSTQPRPISFFDDVVSFTPYRKTKNMVSWGKQLETSLWSLYFDKDPSSNKAQQVFPYYRPSEDYSTGALIPTWHRRSSTDVGFSVDVGFFPYRRSNYSCNTGVQSQSLSSVEQCPRDANGYLVDSATYTEGFSFGFASYATQWLRDSPRLAFETGFAVNIDILHGGNSWFYYQPYPDSSTLGALLRNEDNEALSVAPTPNYAVAFRPMTGIIFGMRHALAPYPLRRRILPFLPWGANDAGGKSTLHRDEWGVRGGLMVGPGYNGLEATMSGELWFGRSLRSDLSAWSNFTAYHPIWNSGMFMRYQYSTIMLESQATERLLDLENTHTVILGWRGQFRFPELRPR
ncbi:MAG: hypothetical protein CL916_01540 [Deltaproteobacteria bacterium]|nr:hypothetical protein [Deltaproteobacteria bacterium]